MKLNDSRYKCWELLKKYSDALAKCCAESSVGIQITDPKPDINNCDGFVNVIIYDIYDFDKERHLLADMINIADFFAVLSDQPMMSDAPHSYTTLRFGIMGIFEESV